MSANSSAFAILDSSFKIPQHIQMIMFRNIAQKESLNISFYGSELCGEEKKHGLFSVYLSEGRESNYIFFTIDQFIDPISGLNIKLLAKCIDHGLSLYFANEGFSIKSLDDIYNCQLLCLSTQSTI